VTDPDHRKTETNYMAADTKKTGPGSEQRTRLWLMYPPKLITRPVIWELGQKFPLVTNIRQASVTDEIGLISLELSGQRKDIKGAIKWLEKMGVKVEPVEINVIES
jgi:L-aspartate semialdehyde sulfurtransferase ferredoxin